MQIAEQCDGLRCDMAMLVTNEVFARTWGERAGPPPADEFWRVSIGKIKERFPNFMFMAEVYWDMEWLLQQQGFDFCYDKRLYDRMTHGSAEEVRAHLSADLEYQNKLVRFIENHDEPRAAAAFEKRSRVAAMLALTLPGARLIYQGQTRGYRVKTPVQLGRRARENDDPETVAFYHRLLSALSTPGLERCRWRLCRASQHGLIAHTWELESEQRKILVIANFGDEPLHGKIRLENIFSEGSWRFEDHLTDWSYRCSQTELFDHGVKVDLPPWSGHLFSVRKIV
jgi:hypothetical protein